MIRNIRCCIAALVILATAACNDDNGETTAYPETNPGIENGALTGTNMHFTGTVTSTDEQGNVFTDPEAHFETAGLDYLVLYMHRTRFVAAMPAMEMRLHELPYTGAGRRIACTQASVVPQLSVKDQGWIPMEAYTLTDVAVEIDNVRCSVRFACDVPKIGRYTVEFAGRLFVEK